LIIGIYEQLSLANPHFSGCGLQLENKLLIFVLLIIKYSEKRMLKL